MVRFKFRKCLCLVDRLPRHIIVLHERTLESLDDVEKFMSAHGNIVDCRETAWDTIIITPIPNSNFLLTEDGIPVLTFGDRIITKDLKVFKVIRGDNGVRIKLH